MPLRLARVCTSSDNEGAFFYIWGRNQLVKCSGLPLWNVSYSKGKEEYITLKSLIWPINAVLIFVF